MPNAFSSAGPAGSLHFGSLPNRFIAFAALVGVLACGGPQLWAQRPGRPPVSSGGEAPAAQGLKSARNITWDLMVGDFNAQDPKPAALRRMLETAPESAPPGQNRP